MSFEEMKKEELFRVAVEDFAVDVKPTDNKQTILAALAEDGVTWEMYLQAYPPAPDEAPAPAVVEPAIATARNVRTKTGPVEVATPDLYLIKMTRDNPYFEFSGYKFTDKHPFVAMPAADADRLLRTEKGFEVASPSEAQEFYS